MSDVPDSQALRKTAGLARNPELLCGLLRARDRGRRPEPFERLLDLEAEVRHDSVGNVVEVLVDIDDARQRYNLFAINEGVGDGITCGEAAG
jgi:hypothetical protein